MFTDRQLAEAALSAGFVRLEDLQELVPASRAQNLSLTTALSRWGLEDERITFLHAALLQLPYVRPDQLRIPGEVLTILPHWQQKKSCVIPLAYEINSEEERLYLAMPAATAAQVTPQLTELIEMRVIPIAASVTALRRALHDEYAAEAERNNHPLPQLRDLLEPATLDRMPEAFLHADNIEIAA